MTTDLSITTLILQASLVVQLVMAGLMVTSLASWTVIFSKLIGLKRVRSRNDEFEREFWSGRSLTEMNEAVARKTDTAAIERIFASGMREFLKLREKRLDSTVQLDGARRAMRASYQRELDVVESNLSFLASVGSVSPYVGLFGTVWGIMHAFVGLSNMTQVTLAAEALVATAIGLFAAIPAVVAYNRFARDIDRIAIQLETFIEEFSNILQRNAGQPVAGGVAGSAALGAGAR
jgi:biopolymer transport protein TolQ